MHELIGGLVVLVGGSRPFCVGRDLRARGAPGGGVGGHPRVLRGVLDCGPFGSDGARHLLGEWREEVRAECQASIKKLGFR